jgi:hypothetical protein
MNTANTIPSPATVTNPPFCESNAGAPAVVDFAVPPVDVDEELVWPVAVALAVEEAEAFPLAVEFEVVLPVAVAAPVSVLLAFPAFVEDWPFVSIRSDYVLER